MKHPQFGSQAYRILCALERGERLTVHDIHQGLGGAWINSPTRRITDLREMGYPIESETVRNGKTTYTRYHLKPRGQMEMFAA